MEPTLLGLALDSSPLIAAERRRQRVAEFIESIFKAHGAIELSLSPVTVAELVHGIYRAKTEQVGLHRREYIEELFSLVPVHPVSGRTGWLVGQIQGYGVLTANIRHFEKIPGLTVIRQD
jgi:tRNA(fMet)-specific endonuclease VapC